MGRGVDWTLTFAGFLKFKNSLSWWEIVGLNNLDKLSFAWLHLKVETHFISSFPRRGNEFTHFLFLISECSVFPPYLLSRQRNPGSDRRGTLLPLPKIYAPGTWLQLKSAVSLLRNGYGRQSSPSQSTGHHSAGGSVNPRSPRIWARYWVCHTCSLFAFRGLSTNFSFIWHLQEGNIGSRLKFPKYSNLPCFIFGVF